MPKRVSPDAEERAAIIEAINAISKGQPTTDAKLQRRAKRGTLSTNLATISIESRVARHRIVKLYPDLASRIAESAGDRGEAKPLRQQLDHNRRLRALAEKRLAQANSYSYRLMERISKQGVEIKRLEQRVQELEAGQSTGLDEELIGGAEIIGVPLPVRSRKQPSKRARFS